MALETIQAPFTDEQVDALNRYQTQSGLHESPAATTSVTPTHPPRSSPPARVGSAPIQSATTPRTGHTPSWPRKP